MSHYNDAPPDLDHAIMDPLSSLQNLQKFISDLKLDVHKKDQKIKELEEELRVCKSQGMNINIRQELRKGIEKAINDILGEVSPVLHLSLCFQCIHVTSPKDIDVLISHTQKSYSQASHISQSSVLIEANQTFPTTVESEEQAAASASSSTSFNYTPGNNVSLMPNHFSHESGEPEFNNNRPSEYQHIYDDYSENKPMSMHTSHNLPIQQQQRRFPGTNGTNNHNNYHNNNNNNRNNNNNNNNRKKNTVFVSWTGKIDRAELDNLFDKNEVSDIRYSPNKQFAHFDFKTIDAMRRAMSHHNGRQDQTFGTLRVEPGKPRSNNTENNNTNNNNNGQRPQNKPYNNNRMQNRQNGINNYKPYNNKYPNSNGINGLGNNLEDSSDTPIHSQLMPQQISNNDSTSL